jgi:hypothetical protein
MTGGFVIDLERVREMAGAGLSPRRAADLLEKMMRSLAEDGPPPPAQAPEKQPESNVLPIRDGM